MVGRGLGLRRREWILGFVFFEYRGGKLGACGGMSGIEGGFHKEGGREGSDVGFWFGRRGWQNSSSSSYTEQVTVVAGISLNDHSDPVKVFDSYGRYFPHPVTRTTRGYMKLDIVRVYHGQELCTNSPRLSTTTSRFSRPTTTFLFFPPRERNLTNRLMYRVNLCVHRTLQYLAAGIPTAIPHMPHDQTISSRSQNLTQCG